VEINVTDVPGMSRYEARSQGSLIGVLEYHRQPSAVVIDHVEVQPEARGLGIAGHLTETALADFKKEGVEIVPLCPYVQSWIAKHQTG
jgi:predicted GNAT family acetyltransferase